MLRYLALGWDIEHIVVEMGREPAHGTGLLDEFASEAGREVEPWSGDGRGAPGRVDVRRCGVCARGIVSEVDE